MLYNLVMVEKLPFKGKIKFGELLMGELLCPCIIYEVPEGNSNSFVYIDFSKDSPAGEKM